MMRQFLPTELFCQLSCMRTGIIMMEDDFFFVDEGGMFFFVQTCFQMMKLIAIEIKGDGLIWTISWVSHHTLNTVFFGWSPSLDYWVGLFLSLIYWWRHFNNMMKDPLLMTSNNPVCKRSLTVSCKQWLITSDFWIFWMVLGWYQKRLNMSWFHILH